MKVTLGLAVQALLAVGSLAASDGKATDLWSTDALSEYDISCRAKSTIIAEEYTLEQLYPHLVTWAWKLKVFFTNQEYPGPWSDQTDPHGLARPLVKMDWYELPAAARRWINTHPDQKLFGVYPDIEGKQPGDKVDPAPKTVFFAPGAIDKILPLFVDDGDKECEGVFSDLDSFTSEIKDGAVHAKLVSHTKEAGKEKFGLEFVVEAQKLKKKPPPKEEKKDQAAETEAAADPTPESTPEVTKDEL